MAAMGEQTIKLRLDTSQLMDAIDALPDEYLDRLADKLVGRIERRLLDRSRRQGW